MFCNTCKVEIQPTYDPPISDGDQTCYGCQLIETPFEDRSDAYARYLNESRVYFMNPSAYNKDRAEDIREDALLEVIQNAGGFYGEACRSFIGSVYVDQRAWVLAMGGDAVRVMLSAALETELTTIADILCVHVPEFVRRDGARLRVASKRAIRKEAALTWAL